LGSQVTIARTLGLTRQAVNLAISKALADLRGLLGDDERPLALLAG
jgi:hypothetical protein